VVKKEKTALVAVFSSGPICPMLYERCIESVPTRYFTDFNDFVWTPLTPFRDFVLTPLIPFSDFMLAPFVATTAPEFTASGVLATLAFLVVFKALIKDFFSMDIWAPLIFCFLASRLTTYSNAGGMPKIFQGFSRSHALRMSDLRPQPGPLAAIRR
jgi:hypothetical protein